MIPWTKEFELDYWTAHKDEKYLDKCNNKYNLFNVNSYFDKKVSLAVDVGGGKFGGALYFFKQAQLKMLVDILVEEYKQMGTIPKDVLAVTADFADLPIEDDKVDALFAWEVLDHALTKEHHYRGQAELVRVLKPGGLFFFEQRIKTKSAQGHTVILSKEEILSGFGGLTKIKEVESRERICVVYGKEDC